MKQKIRFATDLACATFVVGTLVLTLSIFGPNLLLLLTVLVVDVLFVGSMRDEIYRLTRGEYDD